MAGGKWLRVKVDRLAEAKGTSLHAISTRQGWNKQTAINRVETPRPGRYGDFYEVLAGELGVTLEELLSEDYYVEPLRAKLDEVREPLVDMLFRIVKDPKMPEEDRDTAERTIKALTRAG